MAPLLRAVRCLPSALLALTVSHALGASLSRRASENATIPAPISFAPDENWEGIDGSWSTFTIRIGTPPQFVQTYVSFNSYQTWAVLPQGCQAAADQKACADTRGGLFNESASSSFDQIGIYDLYIEQNLNYTGNNAIFGYDVVGLGGNGTDGPTLKNTTVGALAVEDFYLGLFGVNPKPTNFSSDGEPSPSYMSKLKDQEYIPSISAGYTAGAKYRFSGVLASLTLGGYDTSRFIENDVQFSFAPDHDRDTVVAIQSISTPSQVESSPTGTELLPAPIYAFVDSTIAEIWLPIDSCRIFEQEFGLVYDNATDLYLVNSTLHQTLTERNPNVTFAIASGLDGGDRVEITLPYGAFDLTAMNPYQGVQNTSNYFPLRRAANNTQYTLGRTFLQEAYFSVDWERQKFNVSQVDWKQDYEQNIVAIPAYDPATENQNNTYPGAGDSSESKNGGGGLSGGAIAGIVVGVVFGVAILAGLLFWCCWRRRSWAKSSDSIKDEKLGGTESPEPNQKQGRESNIFPKAELEGSSPVPPDSDRKGLLLYNDSSTESGSPHTPSAPSRLSGFFRPGSSSAYSPTTPSGGEGTHSSSNSGVISNGNRSSFLSPLTPTTFASEVDGNERQLYEMPGDMPTIREKDGKSLSEKEALAHRERIYNGVDSAPNSATAVDFAEGVREPRRVNPDDVVKADARHSDEQQTAGALHRAFSFEEDDSKKRTGESTSGSDELYE
ncbi:acid protease [Hortaea werneckii]|nr:acid protease [Hortaea werneckii]